MQDNPEIKQHTFDEMDLMCQNAFLTIVATTGNSANVGLPSVRSNTRALVRELAVIAPGPNPIVPHPLGALEQTV